MIDVQASKKLIPLALAVAAALSLTGCGGGEDETSSEGFYAGTLTSSSFNGFSMVVLEDGTFWNLYGQESGGVLAAAGFIQGTGSADDGTFTSANARDFGKLPATPLTLNANYNADAMSGSLVYSNGALQFNGGSVLTSLYNYDIPASSAAVSGNWILTNFGGAATPMAISSNGILSGQDQTGCAYSGSIVPRPSGKNVFNVSISFGAAPCALPGQTLTGIGLLTEPLDTGTALTILTVDATRTYGFGAIGTR